MHSTWQRFLSRALGFAIRKANGAPECFVQTLMRTNEQLVLSLLDADKPSVDFSLAQPVGPTAQMITKEPFLFIFAKGVVPLGNCLDRLRDALRASPNYSFAYGDEIFVGPTGKMTGHWFKPDQTDPLLLQAGALTGGVICIERDQDGVEELVRELESGGDYHACISRFAMSHTNHSALHVHAALSQSSASTSHPVAPLTGPTTLRTPLTSVIIPTRNGWSVLKPCLESLKSTNWPDGQLEIVIVDNGSDDPEMLTQLSQLEMSGTLRILRDDGPFNFARLINRGIEFSSGELIVLLNNDTVARTSNWLHRLAVYAMDPAYGAVGCKLLYPDGTVQHAGMVFGLRGGVQHVFVGCQKNDGGYNGIANMDRQVSAVTAACLAVRRDAWDQVGGLSEDLAVSFNDVVFCADLLKAGYRNICVAEPLFDHHESKTRGLDNSVEKRARHKREKELARSKHPDLFEQDPAYSEILSKKIPYSLLEPPT
ncbi:glycosyltransferase family 2 protein [Meridianimarinicoccus aquatilis]|uniref:Glycosyltransferase n=1 Tax=Meridianimarinicoccus aquatilis TaxID=2552766 RepID=A0A4R6B1A4_9RHOB|nr:glycosyltransferase [Fluviibacterium aquatile]TDL90437.1 glycosyltransferase [Fluviibacterium aquatile]